MKRVLLLIAVFLTAGIIFAAEIEVTDYSWDVDTPGSLPNIVSSASTGDVISFNFDGDVIHNDNDALLITVDGKSITINGINKKTGNPVIFDGPTRLFSISNSGVLNLNDVIVKENLGLPFVLSTNGRLNAKNCRFLNNGAIDNSNNGGVVRVSSAIADFDNCYFENNKCGGAYGGGGICAYGKSKLTVKNSTFMNNEAKNGGAIQIQGASGTPDPCRIENSTFMNNRAHENSGARGGAIYVRNADTQGLTIKLTVLYSTFSGNYAEQQGGAFGAQANSEQKVEAVLINNIFAGNYITQDIKENDVFMYNFTGTDIRTTAVATNNLYKSDATMGMFNSDETNIEVDFESNIVFQSLTDHPFLQGKKTPVMYKGTNGMPVAMVAENSVAAGKALASSTTIPYFPTKDQLGKDRPANPTIGAVEYQILDPLGGVENIVPENMFVRYDKNYLYIDGAEGRAEIHFYNVNGQLLKISQINSNESVLMPSEQPILICKVKTPTQTKTFKIVR